MTAVPLFPADDQQPPRKCPDCGLPIRRHNYAHAECVSCDWTWRRDAQIAADEPWPKGLLDA